MKPNKASILIPTTIITILLGIIPISNNYAVETTSQAIGQSKYNCEERAKRIAMGKAFKQCTYGINRDSIKWQLKRENITAQYRDQYGEDNNANNYVCIAKLQIECSSKQEADTLTATRKDRNLSVPESIIDNKTIDTIKIPDTSDLMNEIDSNNTATNSNQEKSSHHNSIDEINANTTIIPENSATAIDITKEVTTSPKITTENSTSVTTTPAINTNTNNGITPNSPEPTKETTSGNNTNATTTPTINADTNNGITPNSPGSTKDITSNDAIPATPSAITPNTTTTKPTETNTNLPESTNTNNFNPVEEYGDKLPNTPEGTINKENGATIKRLKTP